MRSEAASFALTRAESLEAVLRLMAAEPGRHGVMAGGTELMVAFNTGRLPVGRPLVSIGQLPELRFVRVEADWVEIGAGVTFTEIRRHEALRRELPLLVRAAGWTGSVANQNRGTLGGNLCNASPAADSPPVLLAYDAEVVLVSAAGRRTLPYREFHLGYKRTALGADELLFSVRVRRGWEGWRTFLRKVGTREAQAISKVAVAGVARVEDGVVREVRLGAASLADRPVRLVAAEAALLGAEVGAEMEAAVRAARAAVFGEARPIDDIRSTARYRTHVAANLVEGFMREMQEVGSRE